MGAGGRVVFVSSASGPSYVGKLSDSDKGWFCRPRTVEEVQQRMADAMQNGARGSSYGLSKALVNCYMLQMANAFPEMTVNSCTPGWIATDLANGMVGGDATNHGAKSPDAAMLVIMKLLFT